MRANVWQAGEIINTIQIEEDCVLLTQVEADAMPLEELALGKFYVISEGAEVLPVPPEEPAE